MWKIQQGKKLHIYTLLQFLIWKCKITTIINTSVDYETLSQDPNEIYVQIYCQKSKIPLQRKDQNCLN